MNQYPPIGPGHRRSSGMSGPPRFNPGSSFRSMPNVPSTASRSPFNMLSIVENVQKMMQVAETMGPMVKQYGPMVKNLPDMMRSLKDFKENTNRNLKEKKEARIEKRDAKEETTETAETAEKKQASKRTESRRPKRKRKGSEEDVPAVMIEIETENVDESFVLESSDLAYLPIQESKMIVGPAAEKAKKKKRENAAQTFEKNKQPLHAIEAHTTTEDIPEPVELLAASEEEYVSGLSRRIQPPPKLFI
ncbi:hypothetical protein A374_10650 [Fictibacillus macauensis ZFHKF-1]|uniref:YqfQ-like protein n=1 Tax=Fictibacillus macauensis ZFHKF-1 TaxID=1196324 RepID=I8J0C7_9BACL|nr:VrrA/YqfQ family protein [Fictibacillus macauensis]EIT85196.1 hypothetical protein A374_10650 [Fictibacillus macauensis ZFHKF-1]